ncbi:MAG: stage II sporulation protein D, partial [Chloroflexi bacterium]
MVNVINRVPLEPYVRGVVVNEGIASFHIEALKAQAAAAR